MSRVIGGVLDLVGDRSERSRFRRDVLAGLSAPRKVLACKYLYDERGSALFDEICDLDEYYLTRTELGIMRRHLPEIAACCGERSVIVEYGSGSSLKTRLLLRSLSQPAALVTIDISREHLADAARKLAAEFPEIEILPVCADYTMTIELPEPTSSAGRRVVFFPGSTIGNFHAEEARHFLRRIARTCGSGGGLILGMDMQKDRATLEAAYNDDRGVTAAFNLNVLRRINDELDADFRVDRFEHRAVYREGAGRIEMHLVSRVPQSVRVGDSEFTFDAGESIRTECSYKFTSEQIDAIAADAGLDVRRRWSDSEGKFTLLFLDIR